MIDSIGISAYAIGSKHFKYRSHTFYNLFNKANIYIPPSVAILWGSFGNKYNGLKRWLESNINNNIQTNLLIHLSNEVGRKVYGKLSNADLFPQLNINEYNKLLTSMPLSAERRIIRRINNIKKHFERYYPRVNLFLTLGLEDNYSKKAVKSLCDLVANNWDYELVRNPTAGNNDLLPLPGMWLEKHNFSAKPKSNYKMILNNDGEDPIWAYPHIKEIVRENAIKKWIKRAVKHNNKCILLFWLAKSQGLAQEPNKLPLRRTKFDFSLYDARKVREYIKYAQRQIERLT